jgi:predicted nuclease with TOPRIM domain
MNRPDFTIAELGAKFGAQQGQVFSELITLEKIVASQQAQIENMTQNESRLTDHIQDLEEEVSLLRSRIFELEETEAMKKPAMTPELAAIAAEGSAIVNQKEEAAPD